jgi:hypothetical protein
LQKLGILSACVLALYLMRQGNEPGIFETIQRWALVIPAIIAQTDLFPYVPTKTQI